MLPFWLNLQWTAQVNRSPIIESFVNSKLLIYTDHHILEFQDHCIVLPCHYLTKSCYGALIDVKVQLVQASSLDKSLNFRIRCSFGKLFLWFITHYIFIIHNYNTTIIHNFSSPCIGYLIQIILSRWFKVFEPTNKGPSEFN